MRDCRWCIYYDEERDDIEWYYSMCRNSKNCTNGKDYYIISQDDDGSFEEEVCTEYTEEQNK